MRVLVTGHNGYIGTVLTPMLMTAGHEVIGLDSDIYSPCGKGCCNLGGKLFLQDLKPILFPHLLAQKMGCW